MQTGVKRRGENQTRDKWKIACEKGVIKKCPGWYNELGRINEGPRGKNEIQISMCMGQSEFLGNGLS
jgi:hypothetical protein